MEELIFFIIFIIFSFLRSLGGRQKPGHPARPATPPGWPGSALPHQRQPVPHPSLGKSYAPGQKLVRRPAAPYLPDSAVVLKEEQEPVQELSQVAAPAAAEERESFFQLDRETVLLGLVFSEILREPRARHRQYRRSDFHRHN